MSPGAEDEKFWARVDRSELSPGGCWIWTGGKDDDGYGRMAKGSSRVAAHREAYIIQVGPIPRGLHVLHRCDNPPCVNAAHLRLGTHQENMAERGARRRTATGTGNGRAKIGPVYVRAIRDLYRIGGYSQLTLAEMFLIDQRTVYDIIHGKLWKEIT